MKRILCAAFVVIAVQACATASGGVSDMSLPDVDFTALRTWTWVPDQASTVSARDHDTVSRRIRDAVEREMEAKGFELVDSDPDFYLGHQLLIDDGASYETVNSYWGSGWNYGRFGPMYAPDENMTRNRNQGLDYTLGTLLIDVFVAEGRELVWRGIAEESVTPDDDPAVRLGKADEAVRDILDRFPPAS